jgi:hypothetical protein
MSMLQSTSPADVIYSPCYDLERGSCYSEDAHTNWLDASVPLEDDLHVHYFRWTYFTTSAILLRKSAIVEVGGWAESEPVCHEHELMLRLLLAGKHFAFMPEPLTVYRAENLHSLSRRDPLQTINDRMRLCSELEHRLLSNGEMTEVRRVALAQERLLAARAAYCLDRDLGRSLCFEALATRPFIPPRNINQYYLSILHVFGFDAAELIAKCFRTASRYWKPNPNVSRS